MKDKKFKYVEDLFDEYIQLMDEKLEITLSLEKAEKKFAALLSTEPNKVYKISEANDLYQGFSSIKKYENKLEDAKCELDELEGLLKDFLMAIPGSKISYDRKDDGEKSKSTFLFSMLEDKISYEKQ